MSDIIEKNVSSTYSGKNRIKKSSIIYKISLTAVLTAFAFILGGIGSVIGIFDPWTNGGSVSLSSLPLTFIGLICGWPYALAGGIIYALLDVLMDGAFAYSWISIILDYFVAFGFSFVSGFFKKPFMEHKWWPFFAAMVSVMVLRFFSSFLSGAIAYPVEPNPWAYSLVYNIGYMGISLAIDLIVGGLLIKPVWNALDKSQFH